MKRKTKKSLEAEAEKKGFGLEFNENPAQVKITRKKTAQESAQRRAPRVDAVVLSKALQEIVSENRTFLKEALETLKPIPINTERKFDIRPPRKWRVDFQRDEKTLLTDSVTITELVN